jgi:ABC-type branched-subunit amino acid transport system permease subunit
VGHQVSRQRYPFRRTLALVVAAMDLPFGYTLTIWSSGAIAIGRYGLPNFGEILAFLLGGITAYVALAFLSIPPTPTASRLVVRRSTALNVCAIFAAIAVSAISALVSSPYLGFFAAAGTSTLVYVVTLAAFNWFVGGEEG